MVDALELSRRQMILRQNALSEALQPKEPEPVVEPEPAEYRPEQLEAFISLDRDRGAPAVLRTYIGGLRDRTDQLATLRNYYDDVEPYGDDNFVFTDPTTGNRTLFNPEGLDMGDVASFGREITQGIFATGGAFLGGTGGLAAGAPTGPGALLTGSTGAALGAGLGNTLGGQVYDNIIAMFAGPDLVDRRSLVSRVAGAGSDFAAGLIGQRVGELAERGVQRLAGGGSRAVSDLYDRFISFRVAPTPGQLTGNRTFQTIESALEASPGGGQVIQEAAREALESTREAVGRVTATNLPSAQRRLAGAVTDEAMGSRMRMAAQGVINRVQARQSAVYDEVFDELGEDATVLSVDALREFRYDLAQRLGRAPESLGPTLNPVLRRVDSIIRDFESGRGLSFRALRDIRSELGRRIGSPMTSGSDGAQHALERALYGVITDDLKFTAGSINPGSLRRLEAADAAFKEWRQGALKTFEKMTNLDADERVWRFIQNSSRDNAEALRRMRTYFTEGEWQDLVAGTINRLGLANPGAQNAAGDAFSVATFLSRWNGSGRGGLSPQAKDVLFGRNSELRRSLDDLSEVIEAMKGSEAVANHSNTARTLIAFNLISILGGGAAAGLSGDPLTGAGTAAGGIASFIVAPRVAARLITNPAFVRWLATPVTRRNGLGAHLGRLTAIAGNSEDPQFLSDVEEYLGALEKQMQETSR